MAGGSSSLNSAFNNTLSGALGLSSGSKSVAVPAGGGSDPYIYKPGKDNGMQASNYSPDSGSSLLDQLEKKLNASQDRMLEQSRQATREATEKSGFEQRRNMDAQIAASRAGNKEQASWKIGDRIETNSVGVQAALDYQSNFANIAAQEKAKDKDLALATRQMLMQGGLAAKQEQRLKEQGIADRLQQKEMAKFESQNAKEMLQMQNQYDSTRRQQEHSLSIESLTRQSQIENDKEARRAAREASERQKDRDSQNNQMMYQGIFGVLGNNSNTRYW